MSLCARVMVMLAALTVAAAGLAHAAGAPGRSLAPRLPDLLRRSPLVVLADVGAITEHDDGRLLQVHLRLSQTLKGKAETAGVKVIEERRFPSVPPVLRTGRRVVAFLEAARMTSQLRRSLAPEQHRRVRNASTFAGTAHVRDFDAMDQVDGPFDVSSHTVGVRQIGQHEGWHKTSHESFQVRSIGFGYPIPFHAIPILTVE